ncbi:MAG: HAD-IA family hydrolase [Alphaproteobacteria bacterium]|nr:HAD-IA family hydrolase [Alphaproteobacteria bacterium]MBL7096315.1 HAD-IA family hydrolase [Alphaproteobacteria bacterium]
MNALPALIFDLDGTLVDTAPDLLGATNAVLRSEHREEIDPATLRHMVGFGARSLIQQAMAATGTPVEDARLPELVDRFIVHYRAHIADDSVLFPGVEETLADLQAKGERMAVLTNKPHDLAVQLLDKLKLTQFFPVIYGAGRMSYVKPDARIFHDVVRDVGGEPGIMVGDSITDVATARAANALVILVNYGYTPEPAHMLGGDVVTGDFRDIPRLARDLARAAL